MNPILQSILQSMKEMAQFLGKKLDKVEGEIKKVAEKSDIELPQVPDYTQTLNELKVNLNKTNKLLAEIKTACEREPQPFPTIPDFPEIPRCSHMETDMSETNELLASLLVEIKKQEITVNLDLE